MAGFSPTLLAGCSLGDCELGRWWASQAGRRGSTRYKNILLFLCCCNKISCASCSVSREVRLRRPSHWLADYVFSLTYLRVLCIGEEVVQERRKTCGSNLKIWSRWWQRIAGVNKHSDSRRGRVIIHSILNHQSCISAAIDRRALNPVLEYFRPICWKNIRLNFPTHVVLSLTQHVAGSRTSSSHIYNTLPISCTFVIMDITTRSQQGLAVISRTLVF